VSKAHEKRGRGELSEGECHQCHLSALQVLCHQAKKAPRFHAQKSKVKAWPSFLFAGALTEGGGAKSLSCFVWPSKVTHSCPFF
jgi:hypothetical protein